LEPFSPSLQLTLCLESTVLAVWAGRLIERLRRRSSSPKKEARTVHDLIENTAFGLDLIEKQDGRK
jgi:hypothetical protein